MFQSQQPQQNNGYNPSPFTHIGVMGAGLGATYYGVKKSGQIKNGIENYGAQKKYFNNINSDLSKYKKNNVIGSNLKNYMTQNNINDVANVKSNLKNNNVYRDLGKMKGYKALGLLGLGTALYGGYKMVSQDMSRHPVLNDV